MPRYMSGSGNVVKGCISKVIDGASVETYSFKFNFSELSRRIDAEYNFLSPPGSVVPTAIFRATQGNEISFTVLTDITERYYKFGVVPDIAFFESLTMPDIPTYLESQSAWISPPRLILGIGPRAWDVVCTSCSIREVFFNRKLVPNRAFVDLSFKTLFVDQEAVKAYMQFLLRSYSKVVSASEDADVSDLQAYIDSRSEFEDSDLDNYLSSRQ